MGQDAEADALEADRCGSAPLPDRVLIETFEFIELCCGSRSSLLDAIRHEDLRGGPRIDLATHPMWDMQLRIVEWLLFLAERRHF